MIRHRSAPPSIAQGFARNASESLYPGLWDGLVSIYAPQMGPQGLKTLIDWSPSRRSASWSSAALWVVDEYGWCIQNSGGAHNISTGITSAWLDFGIFVRFRPISSNTLAGRVIDKNYVTGTIISISATSLSDWGGGVLESSPPYGRWVTLGTTGWHTIGSTRRGTNHLILADGSKGVSGTVSGSALSSDALTIGGGAEVFSGRIAEVLIWGRALTEPEIRILNQFPVAPMWARPRRRAVVQGTALATEATGTGTVQIDALTVEGSGTASILNVGEGAVEIEALEVVGEGTALEPISEGVGIAEIEALTALGEGAFIPVYEGIGSAVMAGLVVSGFGVSGPAVGVGSLLLDPLEVTGQGTTTDPRVYPLVILPAPVFSTPHTRVSRGMLTRMDSGRVRSRRNFDAPLYLLNAMWRFTEDQYSSFKTFFESNLRNGEASFFLETFDLTDDPHYIKPIEWELAFMAPPAHQTSDGLFEVSATLLVVDKSIGEIIENPTNPVPPDPEAPDLEHTFTDFECREMFHLISDRVVSGTAYTVEMAYQKSGPFFPHIYLMADPAWNGHMDIVLNNDYLGEVWFRLVRSSDGKVINSPTKPQESVIRPPILSISGPVVDSGEYNGIGLYGFAYNNQTPENLRIQPYDYYIVPRKRLLWIGNTTDPTLAPNVVTVDNESELGDSVVKWSRDNLDPLIDTEIIPYGAVEDNAAIYRPEFGYAIRARAFHSGGCKSPITFYLVDKAVWIQNFATSYGQGSTISGACDIPFIAMLRTNWEKDEDGEYIYELEAVHVSSGDGCDTYPAGFRETIIGLSRSGFAGISGVYAFRRTISDFDVERQSYLGRTENDGDIYLGYDVRKVTVATFASNNILFTRPAIWNRFPPCFTNSFLVLGAAEITEIGTPASYHISHGKEDDEVLTGPEGTAELIQASWTAYVPREDQDAEPRNLVQEYTAPFMMSNAGGEKKYAAWAYLTLHNDGYIPEVPPELPPLPANPNPGNTPPPPIYYGDDFEVYPELPTLAELFAPPADFFGLNAGRGWSVRDDIVGDVPDRWYLSNVPRNEGVEPWEAYADGDIPSGTSTLTAGEFWRSLDGVNQLPWVFRESFSLYGVDTFEDYSDDMHWLTWESGTNWETEESWVFQDVSVFGSETFEDYVDGTPVPGLLAMGIGWKAEWFLEEIFTAGFESFEDYEDISDLEDSSAPALGEGSEWTGDWLFETIT